MQAGLSHRAQQLFDSMHAARCLPDMRTFTALVSAHARVGDTSAAERAFHGLQVFGLRPDSIAFNALMEAYR